jgi:hypothetical protein
LIAVGPESISDDGKHFGSEWFSDAKEGGSPNSSNSEHRQLELLNPDVIDAPFEVANVTRGWLVVKVKQPHSASTREILGGVAKIISDFIVTQDLSRQTIRQQEIQHYANNVHSSLKTKEVANHIANDARLLMNCERVSVYSIQRGRARLLSVSSVAAVENRTDLLKRQKSLVAVAAQMEEPLGSDRPPSLTSRHGKAVNRLLNDYQAKSNFPFLFGIPLSSSRTHGSYLVAESTADVNRLNFARAVADVVPPAAVAMSNAMKHESIPFGGFLSSIASVFNFISLPKFVVAVGLLTMIVAAMFLVQTDFKIRMEGELRPVVRRVVFAPAEGVVERVLVRQGDLVSVDQPLIQIRSPELELSLSRNEGELQKYSKLLDSKKIALNQASSDPNTAPAIIGQLSSEVSDTEFQIESLEDERDFLEGEAKKLLVVSPIAGNVTTWKVEETLIKRPVRWGDSLISIAYEEGDWEMRFRVPERKVGYLLNARKEQSPSDRDPANLESGSDVEFFFESNPAKKFTTTISEFGKSTEPDSKLGPVAVVVCGAPDGDYDRRHGSRVLGDVDCGKKSIMFVWTRELIDSFRRKFVW